MVAALAAGFAGLFVLALFLWGRYGAAIAFDMVIAYCF
jgi:hypothetical protein